MKRRDFIVSSSAALIGLAAHAQVTDLNDAINKAGRQRMLSQRISKAYQALAHMVEAGSAQQVLDRSLALFDRQLVELKAFAPAPEIQETYVKLEAVWSEFKGVVVGSAPAKEHAAKVIQLDAAILALANQGTLQYERVSAKPLGKLVNIAGRQRMLSQRMAKFYLANAMKVDPQGSVAEIAKARAEFVAATELLRNAPETTPKIKEELALADGQWVFFNQGLQHLDGAQQTPKLMSDVFVASENLLSVMDRITGLYSGIKAPGAA
jgi:hypothetical protein